MSRSSIFNFESFQGFKLGRPLTLLAVLASLAALETGLRQIPDAWLFQPSSRLGYGSFLEREVLPKFESPRILILGSSRTADAFVPRQLDGLLGLPAGSTLNLSQPGGASYEFLRLYQRNRTRLAPVKLVLLNLDEWTFSSGCALDERYFLHASFAERLAFAQPAPIPLRPEEPPEKYAMREREHFQHLEDLQATLLVDGCFSMRLRLPKLSSACFIHLGLKKRRSPKLDENNQVRATDAQEGREGMDPGAIRALADRTYQDFDTHPLLLRHIETFAQLVQEDGGRLVLLQLPARAQYQKEVEARHGPCYRQHRQALEDLARRVGAPLFPFRLPEECGLQDGDYMDAWHLSVKGAQKFTRYIAEWLRQEGFLNSL